MRRAFLLAPMISLVLLSACGVSQPDEDSFRQWREDFLSAETRVIEAEVTALSEESETIFLLRLESAEGEDKVEILAPEALAGVSARISEEDSELSYDGAVLSLGGDAAQRISPMMALPMLMDFLRSGHYEGAWSEELGGEQARVTELEDEQGRRLLLFQQEDNMQPRFVSIESGGKTELKIQIQMIE